jgi:hypothetical protein
MARVKAFSVFFAGFGLYSASMPRKCPTATGLGKNDFPNYFPLRNTLNWPTPQKPPVITHTKLPDKSLGRLMRAEKSLKTRLLSPFRQIPHF